MLSSVESRSHCATPRFASCSQCRIKKFKIHMITRLKKFLSRHLFIRFSFCSILMIFAPICHRPYADVNYQSNYPFKFNCPLNMHDVKRRSALTKSFHAFNVFDGTVTRTLSRSTVQLCKNACGVGRLITFLPE